MAAPMQAPVASGTVCPQLDDSASLGSMVDAREAVALGTRVLRGTSRSEGGGQAVVRQPSCCEAIDNPLFDDGLQAPVEADLGLSQEEQHMGLDGKPQQGLAAALQPLGFADVGAVSGAGEAVIRQAEQHMGSNSEAHPGLRIPSPPAATAVAAVSEVSADAVPACLKTGRHAGPSPEPPAPADVKEAGQAIGASSSNCHPTMGGHHRPEPPHSSSPKQGPSRQGQPAVPAAPGFSDTAIPQEEVQRRSGLRIVPQQQGLATPLQPVAVYVSTVPEVSAAVMECFLTGWHGGSSQQPSVPAGGMKAAGRPMAPSDGQLGSGQAAGGGGAIPPSGHSQQQSGASSGAAQPAAYEMRYAGSKKKAGAKRPGFR